MTAMSPQSREELLRELGKTGDPVADERQLQFIKLLLEARPDVMRRLIQEDWREGWREGQLIGTRASLRQVLAYRQVTISKDDSERIEAMTDPTTLKRWLTQAVTAASVAEALE